MQPEDMKTIHSGRSTTALDLGEVNRGNRMREFNNDPQGRMWFASPGNNTVGYLYLAK